MTRFPFSSHLSHFYSILSCSRVALMDALLEKVYSTPRQCLIIRTLIVRWVKPVTPRPKCKHWSESQPFNLKHRPLALMKAHVSRVCHLSSTDFPSFYPPLSAFYRIRGHWLKSPNILISRSLRSSLANSCRSLCLALVLAAGQAAVRGADQVPAPEAI